MNNLNQHSAIIAVQLQQIISSFAHELDANNGLDIAEFYAQDGAFAVGDYRHTGHAEIRKFYADRLERIPAHHKDGTRVSIHTFVNVRVTVADDFNATAHFTNVNYAGEGHPPVRATISPAMVTTCRMVFRRDADQQWRIVLFEGKPLFVGNDPFVNSQLLKN